MSKMCFQIITYAFLCVIQISLGVYNESYRPQLHFTAEKGWINDPNGLVFFNGNYHLFYQFTPNSINSGLKSWGHSISTDLFHWKALPIALSPIDGGKVDIWSGSAIVDEKNVTGFQTASTAASKVMIAIFTGHSSTQEQYLAYSTDEGITWKYYDKNPIIANPKLNDFRDPKVFHYNNGYSIVLTAGNRVQFYKSTDLKSWQLTGEFGADAGAHSGTWECSDMFPINVTINGTVTEKWVLMVSTYPSTQYFVGHFDGQTFKNDNPANTTLWVEYGPDSYAGITYNLAPNGRRIFMSWMANFGYIDSTPTSVWRGDLSLPRDMRLVYTSEKRVLLASLPVVELDKLSVKSVKITEARVLKSGEALLLNNLTEIQSKLLDIEINCSFNETIAANTGITNNIGVLFSSGTGIELKAYFDAHSNQWVIDRSLAGRHDFSTKFGGVQKAPRLTAVTDLRFRAVLDVSSIELFADNGLTVMSSLFYTDANLAQTVSIYYESADKSKQVNVHSISVNQLKSIWQ